MMRTAGFALYDAANNRLEVIRPGETTTRYIACQNLRPEMHKVHGVQVSGDEIWVFAGSPTNSRPHMKFIYRFSSLSGGGSVML
jgi:hypothetical protein